MPSRGSEAALAPPGNEANEIDHPVAVGTQNEVIGASRGDGAADRSTLRGCRGGVALAHLAVMGVDVATTAGFGVGDLEQADIGE